jgi:hypothetical protein
MDTYHVALVSESSSVAFADVTTVSAALNKQVTRDFGPLWNVNATVDAFDKLESVPVDYWPIMIQDDINEPGAAGYHTDNNGQPYSLVQASDDWPLTAGHECLEMLADPFGNRTIAGAPPKQASGAAKRLKRVVYLVEVCDPCEDASQAYTVNGIEVSDFITPNYYDPTTSSAVRYSFQGNIKSPHQVLKNGYVSFGDPVTNQWYQVVMQGNKAITRSLGVLNAQEQSLRELVDNQVRKLKKGYRTGKAASSSALATAAGRKSGYAEGSIARAKSLRAQIRKLK